MDATAQNSSWTAAKLAALAVVLAVLASALASCGSGDETDPNASCEPIVGESASTASLWVEATLDAIRRDFPAPTVHSRNLWHLSAVMWDSYAVFAPDARPYFAEDQQELPDEERIAAVTTAINFAAHRLLTERYALATGNEESLAQFDALLASRCQVPSDGPAAGSPGAIGLAIADRALAFGADDGALESDGYVDPSYEPVNPPLAVGVGEIEMVDPNRWQPLQLARRVTQNGQVEIGAVQVFIGSNWGSVASFALPEPDDRGITLDPGPPPYLGTSTEDDFIDAAVQVIAYSDLLGGEQGAEPIDISPGARGNNALGSTGGTGHPMNPATGDSYAPNEVPHGDYGRAIAEFWADGPSSETPPGHWNTIAIAASDQIPAGELRWGGEGPGLTRLEWDLRLFFTLNASLHDTAIAVWGAKRAYDYPRPISMIRYLGAGTDDSLPLTPGLVELVTAETAGDDGPHRGLTVGSTAVRTWMGPVNDPESQLAGVGWRIAADWIPYQRPTFVSPAFAAYVSGHSGFSRAAADILTAATGSEYFPGGLFTHTVPAGSLLHEEGPSVDVELQWATYQDAADEAGESRRYGGIHVEVDDIAGRVMGAEIAELTWGRAQTYFG